MSTTKRGQKVEAVSSQPYWKYLPSDLTEKICAVTALLRRVHGCPQFFKVALQHSSNKGNSGSNPWLNKSPLASSHLRRVHGGAQVLKVALQVAAVVQHRLPAIQRLAAALERGAWDA